MMTPTSHCQKNTYFIAGLLCMTFILFPFIHCKSQQEFSKWYFGNNAGLDFSTSPPTILTNGAMTAPEGCATVCDASGNLLFYTNGMTIWNASHSVMANGNGLFGDTSSTQGALAVQHPTNLSQYYVFTLAAEGGSNGACYSIVDMGLAAGQGSVTIKNKPLYTPVCERQVAVRNCNGEWVWVVTCPLNTVNMRSHFLMPSTTTLIATLNSQVNKTYKGKNAIGQMKVSPNGRLIVLASGVNTPSLNAPGGFDLFTVNDAGTLTYSFTLLASTSMSSIPYGVEFSPDGTKVYGITTPMLNGPNSSTLYQWDLCMNTPTAIITNQYSLTVPSGGCGALQKAIDGKIYLAINGSNSLAVISNPNATGASMQFSLNAISLGTTTCRFGLPNFINTYTVPPIGMFNSTINCDYASFVAPPSPTIEVGCSTYSINPYAYSWDFGDVVSGAANTATTPTASHSYSAAGSYTATLVVLTSCNNYTLTKATTIAPCTGIAEQSTAPRMRFYPSPVSRTMIIETPEAVNVTIYNLQGQAMSEYNIRSGTSEINCSLLLPGCYFLKATGENTTSVIKFYKEN
jgi:hypothetical protein